MKSTSGWYDDGNGTNGTNESGFNGLPGGTRRNNGTFDRSRLLGEWWSSREECCEDEVWIYVMSYRTRGVQQSLAPKEQGCSVRCLMD